MTALGLAVQEDADGGHVSSWRDPDGMSFGEFPEGGAPGLLGSVTSYTFRAYAGGPLLEDLR